MPHEWVPWSRGRDFTGDNGLAWSPDQSQLSEAARAAFVVNLLTEDNLPSYHHELMVQVRQQQRVEARGCNSWTAEEARHAMSIRDYLMLRVRWIPWRSSVIGWPQCRPGGRRVRFEGLVGWARRTLKDAGQASRLEIARVCRPPGAGNPRCAPNTGRVANDPVADRLLTRIALDENLHMVFYRDLIAAALALAPDQTMPAIAAEVMGFKMPGAGVPGFLRRSVQIAEAGIYDVRLHRDEVLSPLMRQWQALTLRVTTSAAKQAQSTLAWHLDRLERMAKRYEERRAARVQG